MIKPLELEKAIRKREILPLYFFYGEETFLIDRMVTVLKEEIIQDPQLADFNLVTFYGGESSPQDILHSAKTLPIMSDWRLILVRNADLLKSSWWKESLPYFSNPLPSTCIVFCAEKLVLSGEILTLFKKKGAVVRFYHPPGREIPQWIDRMVKEHGKTITREAVARMCLQLENDLQKLYSELQKVVLYVGERREVRRGDVEEVLSPAGGASIFDLVDCMVRGNLEGALSILKRLLDAGEYPLVILGMIAQRFRLMARAKAMLVKGTSPSVIGNTLGISPFYLKGFLEQVRVFPLERFEEFLSRIFSADWKLKSSFIPRKLILEELLFQLCLQRRQGWGE